jgi:tRNA synthetases class I (R)
VECRLGSAPACSWAEPAKCRLCGCDQLVDVNLCIHLQDFEKIYVRLGIKGLTERGESFYNPMLTGVVEDLVDRGIATDSNGATCIFIEVGAAHSVAGGPAHRAEVLGCFMDRPKPVAALQRRAILDIGPCCRGSRRR